MLIDIPEGSGYELAVGKNGYQGSTQTAGPVVAGEITKVNIQIIGGAVSGTVSDQDGIPVEGAEVKVTIGGETYTALTESDGTYVLIDLPAGTGYTVTASKDGYESGSESGIEVTIRQMTSGKDIVITLNSGTIEGKVTDEDGNPVEGATVRVADGEKIRTAITDEDGNFTICNVTSGSGYTVTASKEGYVDGTAGDIAVVTGEVTENVNITLLRNIGSLSGKVTDSSGNPVAGAKVTAVSGDNEYTKTTDASGEFRFEGVKAGRTYTLTASKEGYYNGRTMGVAVVRGETSVAEVRLLTPVPVANFSFEEQGTDDNPLPGWVVEGTPGATFRQDRRGFGGDARDGHYAMSSWAQTAYTSNVYQTITGLQNGKYTISAYFYHGVTKEAYMYARDMGSPEIRTDIPKVSNWVLVSMDVIVTNGQLTIGFYQDANPGDWFLVDAVTLGYYGPVTDDEPTTPPGSGGSGNDPEQPVIRVDNGKIGLPKPVVGADGIAEAETIKDADFNKALDTAQADEKGVKTVVIDVPAAANANTYEIGITRSALTAGDASYKVEISTEFGKVTVPADMLRNAGIGDADYVTISIGIADTRNLAEDIKDRIGNRPVIELNLKVDGGTVSWNNPASQVTVSIPYSPTADELADPEHIVVWYIDGNGNVMSVPTGRYDAATGTVTFTTTHFSKYAVSFVKKSFADLQGVDWAVKPIEVLASKGAIAGTSKTTYSPKLNITRADFICILVRALGLNAEITSNFDDVKPTDYFYKEVGIAKALGIAKGTGNNRFDPRSQITREEMMVFAARALAYTGKLGLTGAAADLDRFLDASEVSSYAVESAASLVRAGLIFGSNNKIHPKANATRAEAATIVYRLYDLQ